jgi:bifunctional non-homologous end joining protein LigD
VVENRIASLLTRASQGLRFNKHMDETDGLLVFQHACKMGLKGIVSKRRASAYRSGCSPIDILPTWVGP